MAKKSEFLGVDTNLAIIRRVSIQNQWWGPSSSILRSLMISHFYPDSSNPQCATFHHLCSYIGRVESDLGQICEQPGPLDSVPVPVQRKADAQEPRGRLRCREQGER